MFRLKLISSEKIQCLKDYQEKESYKGMFRLKLISSEKHSVFKGLSGEGIIQSQQAETLFTV